MLLVPCGERSREGTDHWLPGGGDVRGLSRAGGQSRGGDESWIQARRRAGVQSETHAAGRKRGFLWFVPRDVGGYPDRRDHGARLGALPGLSAPEQQVLERRCADTVHVVSQSAP